MNLFTLRCGSIASGAKHCFVWCVTAMFLALSLGSVFGQTFTGDITGVATDPNGAALPAATVKIVNTGTQEARETTTNEEGRYTFSQLKPSTYSLTVTASGFKVLTNSGIVLTANQSLEQNLRLEVGAATETVEIVGGQELLETQKADVSVTLDEKVVQALPVNTRNPFVLVHATAGVTAVRTGVSTANQDQNHNRIAMNGGRDMSTLVLIDGVPASAGDWGGLIASPGVDSVQETQVVRNSYDAQYGKTGGGVVNVVTKGGSPAFHGTLFEFHRNDNLDANNWANNRSGARKPEFKRNQYGGNLGGPIWKSKRLYGFFGYEGLRQGSPTSRLVTVPTELERNGDFSQTFNPNGSLAVIYDPLTTRSNPNYDPARPVTAANSLFIRDPFPGNRIPQARWDPVAVNVLKLIPQANQPGQFNNFFASGTNQTINDRYDARVDWTRSDKLTVFGRFTYSPRQDTIPADLFPTAIETAWNDYNPRYHISLGTTYVVSPTLIVNFLIGGGSWTEKQISKGLGFDLTGLGFSASLASQLDAPTPPAINIADYTNIGFTRFLEATRNIVNPQVNLTKEFKSHSLKFGAVMETAQLNSADFNSPSFSFDRFFTTGPDPEIRTATAGNSIASLLLGTSSGGSGQLRLRPAVTQRYWGFYVQDAWKVNPRLTLNYGVRYEIQEGRTERYDRLNYLDLEAPSPIGPRVGLPNLKGALKFVGDDNRRLWGAPKTDFAPRVGVAYQINERLVTRAGYGIYYLPTINEGAFLGSTGYSIDTPFVNSIDNGRTPVNYLRNPFPTGLIAPTGNSLGDLTNVGLGIGSVVRERPTPYIQQYSLDVQYEIGKGTVLEVGYTGTQGRKLSVGSNGLNINQLPDSALALGDALNARVPNPFFGVITTGPLSFAEVTRGQLLRPYPQFGNVTISSPPGASSSYNAGLVKLTKRFSDDLTLIASYQFSKAIDNASENQSWEINDRIRNNNNLALDRSISGHDVPHSLAIAYVYDLPIGRNKAFGSDLPSAVNAVIGGWQFSGLYKYDTGLPLNFFAPNNTFSLGGNQHPNVTSSSDARIDDPRPGADPGVFWFNIAAFSQPAPFTFGSAPRFFSDLRQDSYNILDVAMLKNFRFTERARAQFRAEFFNALNHPVFASPNTTLGNANFGRVLGTRTQPRNIQFGLKFYF